MSNENENNELVPGLNVTKPELEMLRNEPEAFERYTKFCEMKLKEQHEYELEKIKVQNEHELEKIKVQNEHELENLKVEMEEREKIRTYINDICEYVVDVGVNYFATLKSNKPIPEDVAKSIDVSNLDLG